MSRAESKELPSPKDKDQAKRFKTETEDSLTPQKPQPPAEAKNRVSVKSDVVNRIPQTEVISKITIRMQELISHPFWAVYFSLSDPEKISEHWGKGICQGYSTTAYFIGDEKLLQISKLLLNNYELDAHTFFKHVSDARDRVLHNTVSNKDEDHLWSEMGFFLWMIISCQSPTVLYPSINYRNNYCWASTLNPFIKTQYQRYWTELKEQTKPYLKEVLQPDIQPFEQHSLATYPNRMALQGLLEQWQKILEDKRTSASFILCNGEHSIHLTYRPDNSTWRLIDIKNLPYDDTDNNEELSRCIYDAFSTNEQDTVLLPIDATCSNEAALNALINAVDAQPRDMHYRGAYGYTFLSMACVLGDVNIIQPLLHDFNLGEKQQNLLTLVRALQKVIRYRYHLEKTILKVVSDKLYIIIEPLNYKEGLTDAEQQRQLEERLKEEPDKICKFLEDQIHQRISGTSPYTEIDYNRLLSQTISTLRNKLIDTQRIVRYQYTARDQTLFGAEEEKSSTLLHSKPTPSAAK